MIYPDAARYRMNKSCTFFSDSSVGLPRIANRVFARKCPQIFFLDSNRLNYKSMSNYEWPWNFSTWTLSRLSKSIDYGKENEVNKICRYRWFPFYWALSCTTEIPILVQRLTTLIQIKNSFGSVLSDGCNVANSARQSQVFSTQIFNQAREDDVNIF